MTFTYNKNEVTSVENPATSAWQLVNTPFKVGYPVSAMWSYRFAGISDRPGEEGQTLWDAGNDRVNHSVQTEPVDILDFSGQSDPKYIVGMDNNFRWKGFSLGVVMVYYGGHMMRARNKIETFGFSDAPVADYFVNAWTPENKTDIPGIGQYGSTSLGSEQRYENRSVYKADFLKIRNITLGYDLPYNWIKRLGMNNCRLQFQIDDPKAIWTANDVDVDPETLGIRSRTSYTFGLNVNF